MDMIISPLLLSHIHSGKELESAHSPPNEDSIHRPSPFPHNSQTSSLKGHESLWCSGISLFSSITTFPSSLLLERHTPEDTVQKRTHIPPSGVVLYLPCYSIYTLYSWGQLIY
ncbi:hypothetical protein LOD99_1700 [Oopsacas minuta]|uniref:Uncharacterized protein n=1 Tax=Oopsacas minuta TaxID=111878 RepID=A0AAV7K4X3_9METZ|nr:hypothetical protein LOD99_1700 [Oopsacas minuta]